MPLNVSILKLHIGRFAGLSDLSLEFRPDKPNLVIAANRAGKTTVCEFIRFMFYGLDPAEGGRFFPWDGERTVSGTLSLSHGGEQYDISRMQSGQSAGHVSVVFAETGREINLGDKSPGEYFLGIDAWLYDRTVYCQQKQNAKVQEDLSVEALDRFAALLSDGDGIYSEVGKLSEAKNRLMNKEKNGQIDLLMTRRKEYETRMGELEARKGQITELEEKLSECNDRMAELSRQIVLTKAELKDHGDLKAADSLTALADEIEQDESKLRTLANEAKIGQILPNRVAAEELRLSYAEYCRVGAKLTEAKERLMLTEDNLKLEDPTFGDRLDEVEVEKLRRSVDGTRRIRVLLTSFALLFAFLGAGMFLFLSFGPPHWELLQSGLVGLILLILAAVMGITSAALRMRLDRRLADLGLDSPDRFYEAYREYVTYRQSQEVYRDRIAKERVGIRALQDNADKILHTLAGFAPGAQSPAEICERCVELLQAYSTFCELGERITELREKYRLLSEKEAPPQTEEPEDEVLALERQLMQLSEKSEILFAEKTTLESRLAELRAQGDPGKELAALASQNERGLMSLFEQYRTLEMSLELARDAQVRFEKNVKIPLAEEICKMLSFALTPSESFEFGDHFELYYRRGDRRVPVAEAGGGLSELASIALRLCLARRALKLNIPLIFDESFTYVDERSKRALSDFLNEHGAQMLLFASGSDILSAFSQGALTQTFGAAL